jgi:tRNA(1-methyladenosine) methyltransferase and related methyltransferases
MGFELKSARYVAQDALTRLIEKGDTVVDATMGNGHDTLFLAELVGEEGHVHAFDIQPSAVDSTQKRLEEANVADRCSLYCIGHERMANKVNASVKAVLFNLGWLPGGDKGVTTRLETTLQAVESGLNFLEKGGLMSVCIYPGHEEGDREREALLRFVSSLRPQEYNVLHHRFLNAGAGAPECILIQKQ